MRRHAKRAKLRQERQRGHLGEATGAGVEYLILWIYWLIAGYGLRAWRALATLTSLIGLIGVGFSWIGFHHPHPSFEPGPTTAGMAALAAAHDRLLARPLSANRMTAGISPMTTISVRT
jgi:hypothetical protein